MNDEQAATFTHYSAETVKKDFANKLRQAKMFSVLNDSLTDISVTDEELLYVYCKTLKTFELSFPPSFCEKVFICEVPTSNFLFLLLYCNVC